MTDEVMISHLNPEQQESYFRSVQKFLHESRALDSLADILLTSSTCTVLQDLLFSTAIAALLASTFMTTFEHVRCDMSRLSV